MRIEVNGETLEIEEGATVSRLIELIGALGGPVAVERNREIVPRAEHETTLLREGDRLEVVHFVGGG